MNWQDLCDIVVAYIKEHKLYALCLGIFILVAWIVFLNTAKYGKQSQTAHNVAKTAQNVNVQGSPDISDNAPSLSALEKFKTDEIVVDLSGAVKKPGVYKLTKGSRLNDLLREGGGLLPNASYEWLAKKLNLAYQIKDSEKFYIPFEWDFNQCLSADLSTLVLPEERTAAVVQDFIPTVNSTANAAAPAKTTNTVSSTTATATPSATSTKINVNTAALSQLDMLPGIGTTYAQKIVTNRPYTDLSDFVVKTKLPKSTLDKIKDLVEF